MSKISIKEKKDRRPNPYWNTDSDPPLEDDYSEESDANSVCEDDSVSYSNRKRVEE